MKGFGATFLQLESNDTLHLSDVLYVLGMKRNLVSISALKDKGYKVAFSNGKVLAWQKKSSMDTTKVIGTREESLYRLNTPPVQSLVHDSTSMGELWHRILAHLNYRALPVVKNIVTGIPVLQVDHDGTCKGCALRNNAKKSFPDSESRSKEILDLVHSDFVAQ